MVSKQTIITDFFKKSEKKKNIILPKNDGVQGIFVQSENDKLSLMIRELGINKLICHITLDQFKKLESCGTNISPQKVKDIIPHLDMESCGKIAIAMINYGIINRNSFNNSLL